MERELPTIEIKGTSFIVDIDKNELRQRTDETNAISFNVFVDYGTHYQVYYDMARKNMVDIETIDTSNIELIKIPPMTQLDPIGMSNKYGVPLEGIGLKSDFEVMVDQALLKERLNGVLPRIDVAGEPFIIDWRLKELRSEQDVTARIDIRQLEISDDGNYNCFYNTETRSVFTVDKNTTTVPGSLIALEIPNELELDPVAVSREYFNRDTELLRQFPIQKDLRARIVPLSETQLHQTLVSNKKRMEEQLNNEMTRQVKRSKGKRI